MSMHKIEWVADLPIPVGTAPLWHAAEQRLYWSDFEGGILYSLDPATGEVEKCLEDGRPIGGITVQADGSLLLFRDQANIVVWQDGRIVSTVIQGIADFRKTEFTGAVAAPCGRVFCATRSDMNHPGRLFCLDLNGRLNLVADVFAIPAGMGFSPDNRFFYFNDAHSTRLMTWRLEYDPSDGSLTNRVPFRESGALDDPGAPMGLTVDATGHLWIARWGGSALMRYDADGALVDKIPLPVKKPQCLCFGGPQLDSLFVTTSGGHRRQIEGLRAGGIACITIPGVQGMAVNASRIRIAGAA
jgi:sugar lactone lactonase YvrE